MIPFLLIIHFFFTNIIAQQQTDDDDECAYISGQHCDANGICKYCAMCLQSSCILSKSSNCNTTQFGTTSLYSWYDYCLSSDNDSSGDYCATSTECYQYRKSVGPPSVSYAWNNLTCSTSTCMLITDNGAPPPPPSSLENNNNAVENNNNAPNQHHNNSTSNENRAPHRYYEERSIFHNPAAIALTAVCVLTLAVSIGWFCRYSKKRDYFRPKKDNMRHASVTSSIPDSAPPSFRSTPPDMAVIRHPQCSNPSSLIETLPSYLTPYTSPPKYEQAIVTQIRGLRGEDVDSAVGHGEPSMWVPIYFSNQGFRRGVQQGEVFGFTPNHSYWLQHYHSNQQHSALQEPPTTDISAVQSAEQSGSSGQR